jgi:hypothetical protein
LLPDVVRPWPPPRGPGQRPDRKLSPMQARMGTRLGTKSTGPSSKSARLPPASTARPTATSIPQATSILRQRRPWVRTSKAAHTSQRRARRASRRLPTATRPGGLVGLDQGDEVKVSRGGHARLRGAIPDRHPGDRQHRDQRPSADALAARPQASWIRYTFRIADQRDPPAGTMVPPPGLAGCRSAAQALTWPDSRLAWDTRQRPPAVSHGQTCPTSACAWRGLRSSPPGRRRQNSRGVEDAIRRVRNAHLDQCRVGVRGLRSLLYHPSEVFRNP